MSGITITRKGVVEEAVETCLKSYASKGIDSCLDEVYKNLLINKVKFPLLEYAATLFYDQIPNNDQIAFCNGISAQKTIGGNVLLGILLQKRLPTHFEESVEKASEYIQDGEVWYACDIIGERVWGYSLLHQPAKLIPVIKKLSTHESRWVVRSLGAGCHYAIKKGLKKPHVDQIFQFLLLMANTRDKEIKQGVGWAAKTTAKFHPDIIKRHQQQIEAGIVAGWFRTKVNLGLKRHEYAKGN